MKCPNCKKDYEIAVCPLCHGEIKERRGLNIPLGDTLQEICYGMGEKYARFYRLAVLRAEGRLPTKLCFGCEEKPLGFLTGAKAWFNPVIITQISSYRQVYYKIISH